MYKEAKYPSETNPNNLSSSDLVLEDFLREVYEMHTYNCNEYESADPTLAKSFREVVWGWNGENGDDVRELPKELNKKKLGE